MKKLVITASPDAGSGSGAPVAKKKAKDGDKKQVGEHSVGRKIIRLGLESNLLVNILHNLVVHLTPILSHKVKTKDWLVYKIG